MDVRPGYKQTEVGWIPEDWAVDALGSIAPLQRGFDLPMSQRRDGPFPVVYSNGIENFHAQAMVKGPGVVTGRSGTIGRVHYVKGDYWPHNTSLWVTRFNKNAPRFIYHLYTQIGFDRFASGSGVPTLNRNDVHAFRIAVPTDMAEQHAIAEALSDADAMIESLEQLLTKKRQIKQGAMQELLTGKRRLLGFTGAWATRRIAEIAQVKTGPFGSTLHESDYVQMGTPIITVEHLGEFGVTRQNLPLVSDEDRKRLHAYSLDVGDIVFSRVGSVDRNALIREKESGWLFSGRLLRVRPDSTKVFSAFLSYQFHTDQFRNSVLVVAVGQTMASLNTKILNSLTVALPSIAEQIAIASILSDMDIELTTLDARLTKARQLKQGMMQVLLTGQIRLPLEGPQ